jgi:chromosome segregation ATPase
LWTIAVEIRDDDGIVVEPGGTMSHQEFEEIRTRLGGLESTTGGLVRDVEVLKTDVAVLKRDVAGLKTDVAGLKADVADSRRHMGVLHEEVLDRIKGIREDDSLRQEMRAGFAELRQLFLDHTERRIHTLEQTKHPGPPKLR